MSHSTSHILLKGELYEALIEVRDVVAAGWCRGSYRDGLGRHCLVGAISAVAGSRDLFAPMLDALAFTHARDAISWNDGVSGQHEVVRRIDDAIRKVVETT